MTELWEVAARLTPGRTSRDDVTLFDSVGFALEDFTVLKYAQQRVVGIDLVTYVDLVADPDDPRDLFGAYLAPRPVRPR